MRIISTTTSHGFHPACSSMTPATLLTAMTDPTDRSMPPVTITNVSATARMMRCALLISRFEIVLNCRIRP